jgi:WS/DGAT/MGAT family acyltransferase
MGAPRYERLSAQDTSFLHIERPEQPQHVGALALFEAGPLLDDEGHLRIDEVRAAVESRLHLVPRFRKRLMHVPLAQGRPVWVDDDRFDITYHVRLTALPRPGNEEQLKALMGRLQSQLLDRDRPLWELWFVEGVEHDRVALIQKTHHALVDGISGVDVATVLFDFSPEPTVVEPDVWDPRRAPDPVRLLADSLVQRATEPTEIARSVRAALRTPAAMLSRVTNAGRAAALSLRSAPRLPWNAPIGPHRRWEPVRVPLDLVKEIKQASGTTVNDVVLAACAGALREFLIERGEVVDGLVAKAMVPVSVRGDDERGALGNRVSLVVADLPIGEPDPRKRLAFVAENMSEVKASGVAIGASDLVQLTSYAPPTILALAARLSVRSMAFNTTITNVPGPQVPLYCMGARLLEAFPYVGIVRNQALTIGLISYDGQLGFGITGDRELLPDLASLASHIDKAFNELSTTEVGG